MKKSITIFYAGIGKTIVAVQYVLPHNKIINGNLIIYYSVLYKITLKLICPG